MTDLHCWFEVYQPTLIWHTLFAAEARVELNPGHRFLMQSGDLGFVVAFDELNAVKLSNLRDQSHQTKIEGAFRLENFMKLSSFNHHVTPTSTATVDDDESMVMRAESFRVSIADRRKSVISMKPSNFALNKLKVGVRCVFPGSVCV